MLLLQKQEPESGLRKASPHLWGALRRLLAPEECEQIGRICLLAHRMGGHLELDFEREDGVSYNPRWARVALILMDNCGMRSPTELGAGIAASLLETAEGLENGESIGVIPPETLKFALAALALLRGKTTDAPSPALAIASALCLDRARHLHLCSLPDRVSRLESLQSRVRDLVPELEFSYPHLALLLRAWLARSARGNRAASQLPERN